MNHSYKTNFLKKTLKGYSKIDGASFGATNPFGEINDLIVSKQMEILNDAIEHYNRLEDIKKFTRLALDDIENINEDDIKDAMEIEKKISVDDDAALEKLLSSPEFIDDILNDL